MTSNEINGIINVLKPPGMTSHDVVGFIRRTLGIKKVGHTGTLDPGVAGVLPICIGKATRIIEYMSEDVKHYRAEMTLGCSTDTQDSFGKVIAQHDASQIAQDTVRAVIESLAGDVWQVPPMVSALKHKGKKLYELAREGIEIERKPRKIHIFGIEVIKYEGFGTHAPKVLFDVRCSKGTYVRTICHDIGEKLGCGGYMSFLVRTATGPFKIIDAFILDEIVSAADSGQIGKMIIPLNNVLPLMAVIVNDNVIKSIRHGNRIYSAGIIEMPDELEENQVVKLVSLSEGCLATARVIFDTKDPAESKTEEKRYIFQPLKVLC